MKKCHESPVEPTDTAHAQHQLHIWYYNTQHRMCWMYVWMEWGSEKKKEISELEKGAADIYMNVNHPHMWTVCNAWACARVVINKKKILNTISIYLVSSISQRQYIFVLLVFVFLFFFLSAIDRCVPFLIAYATDSAFIHPHLYHYFFLPEIPIIRHIRIILMLAAH